MVVRSSIRCRLIHPFTGSAKARTAELKDVIIIAYSTPVSQLKSFKRPCTVCELTTCITQANAVLFPRHDARVSLTTRAAASRDRALRFCPTNALARFSALGILHVSCLLPLFRSHSQARSWSVFCLLCVAMFYMPSPFHVSDPVCDWYITPAPVPTPAFAPLSQTKSKCAIRRNPKYSSSYRSVPCAAIIGQDQCRRQSSGTKPAAHVGAGAVRLGLRAPDHGPVPEHSASPC